MDTRRAKEYGVAPESLAQRWAKRAQRLSVEREQLRRVVGSARWQDLTPADTETKANALASPTGLTRQRSTFTRRDVIQGWCEQLPHGAPVATVEELADWFLDTERAVAVARHVGSLTQRDVIRRADGRVVTGSAEERRYSTPGCWPRKGG